MDRLKRLGLVGLMAFLALNVWTGSPLLALWIGSRVQGQASQPSMGAFVAVLGCLIAFSFVLYQALKRVSYAYRAATGTLPSVRTHAPWLRSLRGERPDYVAAARVSGAERIVVVTVIVAAVIFEFWFFFLSGSSIGGSSGR
jgi:hypothetical protein